MRAAFEMAGTATIYLLAAVGIAAVWTAVAVILYQIVSFLRDCFRTKP